MLNLLASHRLRIFLTCWILFTVHFATNVVREHYAIFALIEQGDLKCDRYLGFHADIFQYEDGHAYVGNNIMGSIIALPPMLLFDPLLDKLEAYSQRKLEERGGEVEAVYDTQHPNRRDMFRKVKEAGLDLRFGASTAITSAFVMAPLSAMLVLLMYRILMERGLARGRATWLALLFGLGTPIFYRTSHLNHNMFLMETLFLAFYLLWVQPGSTYALSMKRRIAAGFLVGCAFSLDYAGAIPCAVLYAYLVLARLPSASLATSLKESIPFVLAGIPCVLFLMGTQWWMYGNPFMPGQFAMPPVNYTEEGLRGIAWPTMEVFFKNLFSPGWGLFTFGPLLLVALWPLVKRREETLILPYRERALGLVFVFTFMLFCAANQYSLMQFNTGFRYLLPIVPFVFLFAAEHLSRMRRIPLIVLSTLAIFHTWVLTMMRVVQDTEKNLRDAGIAQGIREIDVPGYWDTMLSETAVPLSYRMLFSEGIQLPWLSVLRATSGGRGLLASPLLPVGILFVCGLAIFAIWRVGLKLEESRGGSVATPPDAPAAPSGTPASVRTA